MMPSGAEVEAQFASASSTSKVDAVVDALASFGALPDYIAADFWKYVVIRGGGHTLKILVAPDYAALGSPDPFRIGRASPFCAQAICDSLGQVILPSRKIVREVQRAASPRLAFIDVKGAPWHIPIAQIETERALVAANDGADEKFAALGISPGEGLTIGYRKAIVVGPSLDGSKVAIYGGIGTNLDPASGLREVVQPYYTGHASSYADYSHGIVLVSRKAILDGESVDLRFDVFGSPDPSVVALVNDHGVVFDPVFPNAGPHSRAQFGGKVIPKGSGSSSSSSGSKTKPALPPPAAPASSPGKGAAVIAVLTFALYYLGRALF